MSPDRVDLVEDALASDDPATLYRDLVDDWNAVYSRLVKASVQLQVVAESVDNETVKDMLLAQSRGISVAMGFMRDYRQEPAE